MFWFIFVAALLILVAMAFGVGYHVGRIVEMRWWEAHAPSRLPQIHRRPPAM